MASDVPAILPPGAQKVDVNSLTVQQLDALQKQLDEELEFLTTSSQSLRMVEQKFLQSQQSLRAVRPENLQKDILVPLTNTMYVPGKLADGERVMIDIGTGYYAEMSVSAANNYFERRTKFITSQLESLSNVLSEKAKTRAFLREVFTSKLQALIAAQAQKGTVGAS